MYGLFFAGIFLEPIIGKYKYIVGYIASGIIASIVGIWWHQNTVSVGASGAIFGLCGILIPLLPSNRVQSPAKKPMLIFNGIFIGFNLLAGIRRNADNAANIGGLISGIVLGILFCFFIKPPKPKRKYTRKPKVLAPAKDSEEKES